MRKSKVQQSQLVAILPVAVLLRKPGFSRAIDTRYM
jgi:hypothetical protein